MMNQQSEASNGLVAAAMLASGIGCFFLGLFTDLSEANKVIEGILTFSNRPLKKHCDRSLYPL
jgi:hypothetical protein